MRLLWINANPNPNPGGTELHSIDFINALEELNSIELFKVVAKGSFVDRHTSDRNKFYVSLRSEFSPANTLKLIRIARNLKPHVVVGNNGKEYLNTYMAGRLSGAKVVLFRHMLNRLPPLLVSLVLKRVDKIVAVSEASKRRLMAQGIEEAKIEVIPNFVDEGRFSLKEGEREALRKLLGVAEDEVVVSFLGKVAEGKGIFDFYEVAKRLSKSPVKFRFFVIGYGRDLEKVRERAIKDGIYGRFLFTGMTEEPEKYLKASDIMLALSRGEESFGRVVVEGFATKNLVFVYDVENLRYLVENGVNGFVCKMGDIEKIAGLVLEVIKERNRFYKLREEAYKTYLINYTKEAVLGRFIKLLEALHFDKTCLMF